MSCPTNCVSASCPWTWLTRNWSLLCILLKSPVRSWTVTSVTRPTSLSGVSVGVSPKSCLLNISGARRLYHTFAFHLSLIFRAAVRDFFSAIRASPKEGAYLTIPGSAAPTSYRNRDPDSNSGQWEDQRNQKNRLEACPRLRRIGDDLDAERSRSRVPRDV